MNKFGLLDSLIDSPDCELAIVRWANEFIGSASVEQEHRARHVILLHIMGAMKARSRFLVSRNICTLNARRVRALMAIQDELVNLMVDVAMQRIDPNADLMRVEILRLRINELCPNVTELVDSANALHRIALAGAVSVTL